MFPTANGKAQRVGKSENGSQGPQQGGKGEERKGRGKEGKGKEGRGKKRKMTASDKGDKGLK